VLSRKAASQSGDEGTVDLDAVDGEVAQVAQVAVPDADNSEVPPKIPQPASACGSQPPSADSTTAAAAMAT